MDSREALRGLLLALEPIAHNHRPATPPDFSDEDPENWTTGTPATHSIAFPPRGPMVDAVIDAILSSDWLRDTLAAERERSAWQLISEVPPPHNEVVLLFWRDWRGAEYVEATRYSTGERLPNGYSNYSEHGWATHWMPITSTATIRNLAPEA